MPTVIILKNGYMPPKEAFSEKGKTYILTTEKEQVPVFLLTVAKGNLELNFAGEGSDMEYAFSLGKILGTEKTVKVYSDDERLLKLVDEKETTKAPRRKRVQEKKVQEETSPESDDAFPMNKPEAQAPKEAESEKKERSPRKRKGNIEKEGKALSEITEDEIKKLLKKNGYDTKYVPPIMDALKTSKSKMTLDLYVRTKVSMMENEQKVITALGDLIKEEYGQ